MDEGWIITTAITLGIGVISYFLKRTMNQLDCTVQQLQKIERDQALSGEKGQKIPHITYSEPG